jgi:hypothetical protein
MAQTLDDDSVPANARVWDFLMPPKSCSTFPLSSERLICEVLQSQEASRVLDHRTSFLAIFVSDRDVERGERHGFPVEVRTDVSAFRSSSNHPRYLCRSSFGFVIYWLIPPSLNRRD